MGNATDVGAVESALTGPVVTPLATTPSTTNPGGGTNTTAPATMQQAADARTELNRQVVANLQDVFNSPIAQQLPEAQIVAIQDFNGDGFADVLGAMLVEVRDAAGLVIGVQAIFFLFDGLDVNGGLLAPPFVTRIFTGTLEQAVRGCFANGVHFLALTV